MSAQVDLRGFKYALTPVLDRQKWQLEQAQRKLEKLQGAIHKARLQHEAMQTAYQERAAQTAQAVTRGLDPAEYQRTLIYLAWQRGEIEKNKDAMRLLEEQKAALMAACIEAQKKVDLTSTHRKDSLDDYVLAERTRQDNEMDREWIARRLWRDAAGETGNALDTM